MNTMENIFIGKEIWLELMKFIASDKFSSLFILTDENVNKNCLPLLLDECEALKQATVIEIPAGEEEKNITTAAKILSVLLENNADRKCLLINLGGGVVSDIGGFVASVYKRGICFINIPTTLLSMVDASVGGKNAINFLERKNIIGTFTHPEAIFIFPDFVKSLGKRDVRSGYAEIIKHLLLSDAERWKKVLSDPKFLTDESNIEELIDHSVKFKIKITSDDFRESGKRAILNFGHTFGHALESYSFSGNNPLTHGEAIAVGMIGELFLSNKLTGFPISEMEATVLFIKKLFYEINLNCSAEDLIPFLYADKKNARDKIAFSLLKSPGEPAGIFYPEIESIVQSLIYMIDEFSRMPVND